MKHDMSDPCPHCPFRTDIHGYLTRARVAEISSAVLSGMEFPCHKTTVSVESDDGWEEMVADEGSQECAGAAIFAAHHGRSSQMSRIAERLGFKVAALNMAAPVCKSARSMFRVHASIR